MLIDQVAITIKAGDGGDGCVSFRRNAQTARGGPDGGNGGNGGSVYVQGSSNLSDLQEFQYKKLAKGEDGISGKKNNLFGKNGQDITVSVPFGTSIIDLDTREIIEVENTNIVLLARGGKGGKGNDEFKTATNQSPAYAQKGEKGEERNVFLELRLIADAGLVGYPNAGKSSILKAITNANPKVGNYPFTTLEPTRGVAGKIVIADIPGILEGAAKGKGLGLQFLKHIEKTKILVYCIDITDDSIEKTYKILQKEFSEYNDTLLKKPEIVLLTKIDLVTQDIVETQKKIFEIDGKTVMGFSIYQPKTIENFSNVLQKFAV